MTAGWKSLRITFPLLAGAGILASVVVLSALLGDLRQTDVLLRDVKPWWLVGVLALAVVDHGVRFWRWDLLLRRVSPPARDRRWSALAYLAGSLLIFTPARAGEVAKSVYARDLLSVPVATSLPVLAAERVVDFAVMALLSVVGLVLIGKTANFAAAAVVLVGAILLITAGIPLAKRLAERFAKRSAVAARISDELDQVDESRRTLLGSRALSTNAGLGTAAWVLETVAYAAALAAIGVAVEPQLFAVALAVFPLASMGGSLSLLLGGIGATEGGLAALGVIFGGLSVDVALLAALISRAAILGTVVVSGLVALWLIRRRPAPLPAEAP